MCTKCVDEDATLRRHEGPASKKSRAVETSTVRVRPPNKNDMGDIFEGGRTSNEHFLVNLEVRTSVTEMCPSYVFRINIIIRLHETD